MSSTSTQPNATLYINNLNDKVNKEELRLQLYALFTTYGKIIDIVASKGKSMRGQAFLVFSDLASATTAMRACEGMVFYDKPLRIHYAKQKSYATLRKEDPNFVPPNTVHAVSAVQNVQQKRSREEEVIEAPVAKRDKAEEESDEEMEIDDDEENAQAVEAGATPRLYCTNLPQEVTNGVLAVLFQQYTGFQSCQVTPSPTPNANGEKVKTAEVFFESPATAAVAKKNLDGFALKKGWLMSVAYMQ